MFLTLFLFREYNSQFVIKAPDFLHMPNDVYLNLIIPIYTQSFQHLLADNHIAENML